MSECLTGGNTALKIKLEGNSEGQSVKARLARAIHSTSHHQKSLDVTVNNDLDLCMCNGKENIMRVPSFNTQCRPRMNSHQMFLCEKMENCDSGVESPRNGEDPEPRGLLYSDVSEGDFRSAVNGLGSTSSSLYSDISEDPNQEDSSNAGKVDSKNCDISRKDAHQNMNCGHSGMLQSSDNENVGHPKEVFDTTNTVAEMQDLHLGDTVGDNVFDDGSTSTTAPFKVESKSARDDQVATEKLQTPDFSSSLLDSSQESIEDNDSDGDDLVAFDFHMYTTKKPAITTPKKLPPSFHLSPVVTPPVHVPQKEKKYENQIDIKKILAHNSRIEKKTGCPPQQIHHELEHTISNGGIDNFIQSIKANCEESDFLLPQHQHKLEKYKLNEEDEDIGDEIPGESIFTNVTHGSKGHVISPVTVNGGAELKGIERQMRSKNAAELHELLCGGWVLMHYLASPCPDEVSKWLFDTMSHHQAVHVIDACFQALWTLLQAGSEGRNRGIQTWYLSSRYLVKVLLELGATLTTLFPEGTTHLAHELFSEENLAELKNIEPAAPEATTSPCLSSVRNVAHIVKFTTHCLNCCPSKYSALELKCLLVVLSRLSLEPQLQDCSVDVQMCVSTVLNTVEQSYWDTEARDLCHLLAQVTNNHQNQYHVLELLPLTSRGIQMRRCLGFLLLKRLVVLFNPSSVDKIPSDAVQETGTASTVQVSELVPVCKSIKPSNGSDYRLLYTIICILDTTIGNDNLQHSDKRSLDDLILILKSLNGDIKDPRSVYMKRTKVKDVLVRTISRLTFLSQSTTKTQSSLKHFFENPATKIKSDIELLKESPRKHPSITSDNNDEADPNTSPETDCEEMEYEMETSAGPVLPTLELSDVKKTLFRHEEEA